MYDFILSISMLLASKNADQYKATFGSLAVPQCWIVQIRTELS